MEKNNQSVTGGRHNFKRGHFRKITSQSQIEEKRKKLHNFCQGGASWKTKPKNSLLFTHFLRTAKEAKIEKQKQPQHTYTYINTNLKGHRRKRTHKKKKKNTNSCSNRHIEIDNIYSISIYHITKQKKTYKPNPSSSPSLHIETQKP